MKKLIFNLFVMLVLCVGFTACHSNDVETVNYNEYKQQTFVADFNSAFGVSASDYANHQWGMNIVPLIDVTQKTTRTANVNGNQWGSGEYADFPQPAPITSDELTAVLNVFNDKGNESYEPLVDYEDFFVQQVYTGTAKYKAANGETVTGSQKMNRLFCTTKYKQVKWWPVEFEEMDHYEPDYVNNSNNGNITAWDGCTLMLKSSTTNWSYESSQGGSHTFYYWRMEKINGNYYVGFDFASVRQAGANLNEQVDRDFIYNDWIIKIVPGKGTTPPPVDVERVRIMAEDLGANVSDFDYNDVVFDIKFIKNGNQYTADIILQAAGGTLPLTIGGREVHDLFEVPVNEMVNTYAGRHYEKAPVPFTVTLNGPFDNAWDAINALPIYVQNPNGQVIQLTINPGSPAEMFAVPVTTDWSDERVSIRYQYPTFVDWIRDSTIQWWEE